VELHVAELASKSDNLRYPYLSNGVKTVEAPIELEHGRSHKGTLYYTAEFISALALKNIKFEPQTTEKDRIASHDDSDDSSNGWSESDDDDIPAEVTYKPDPVTNNVPVTATDVDAEPNEAGEPNGVVDKKAEVENGVELSDEELLAQREVFVVHVGWFSLIFCSRIGNYCFSCHFWSPSWQGSLGHFVG